MDLLMIQLQGLTGIALVVLTFFFFKMISGHFDTKNSVVNLKDVKAEDNQYTKWAAEEHAKAAIANQKAAEANLKAEEIRLERIRLQNDA